MKEFFKKFFKDRGTKFLIELLIYFIIFGILGIDVTRIWAGALVISTLSILDAIEGK